jgi:hypothetical protein
MGGPSRNMFMIQVCHYINVHRTILSESSALFRKGLRQPVACADRSPIAAVRRDW